MEKIQRDKKNSIARRSYIGFLFQSFFKRPFGYIVAILYIVYLSVVLIIVPKVIHANPLFIWSNAAFNMPIFNLFFIAAAASSLAVCIFRISREDGTELSLCAKPLTKRTLISGKTIVYLLIMLIIAALAVGIVALTKPIFGEFSLLNLSGIEQEKYIGLIISMLVGNVVNMLLFGGIAVLISMIGGQVATMIGTIGVAFIMCLVNVVFPMAVSTPNDVLENKYNTSINSVSANTRSQFNKNDKASALKQFAAIQCIVDDDGTKSKHFDTYEYWTKATKEAGISGTNYFDFGKQLSNLFTSFGVDESKLKEASRLFIGLNNSTNYKIDPQTHIIKQENLSKGEYPVAVYDVFSSQGIYYPVVRMLAAPMTLSKSNWSVVSTYYGYNFDSVVVASTSPEKTQYPYAERPKIGLDRSWFRMSDLVMNDAQLAASEKLFNTITDAQYTEHWGQYRSSIKEPYSAQKVIASDESGAFFETGKFFDLTIQQRLKITSQINIHWSLLAQDKQINLIKDYFASKTPAEIVNYPFDSLTVKEWYSYTVQDQSGTHHINYDIQKQLMNIFNYGIYVANPDSEDFDLYSKFVTSSLDYCETFNNLYQYKCTSFYNTNILVGVWSAIAILFFSCSIVVYRKTDFK